MSVPTEAKADQKLIRALGVPGLAANIVNFTVGASIFVLPALIATTLGAASPLAYIVCAIAMCLFVTCFAMAGSRVSLTGGLYAYVEVAFGRYIGFLSGVLLWFTVLLGVSGVVNLFADSVGHFTDALASPVGRFFVILLIFVVLAVINFRSVRAGARTVEAVTVIKLAPLLIFVFAGLFFVRPSAIEWPGWPGTKALGESVLLLIFAFMGIETALIPSGEVKNPARTVPRAIFIALGITTLLYVLIQLVAQGVLGSELGSHPTAPLADAAARFLGNIGRTLLLAGATISAFGFVASDVLSSPRIVFAFGRDGILPAWFARVHPRFRTPHIAVITYTIIAFLVSLFSTFKKLAILSDVVALLLYFLCCLAAFELTRRDVRGKGAPFVFPGAKVVPILSIGMIIWILAHATMQQFGVTAIVLGIASLLYLFRRKTSRMIELSETE